VLEIFVWPHVHDLVERAEVRVPEGAELGMLLAKRLALREAILELGHGSGAQGIGANFVDHLILLLLDSFIGAPRPAGEPRRPAVRTTA
jgi:hypothetical protein